MGKSLIKVLVGQRRVGKSVLLSQLMEIIQRTEKNTQIIYINKELHEFRDIVHADDLMHYLNKNIKKRKRVALFIDEVQDIESFETALRDLVTRAQYDIYCTGNNANLLSGELATFLGGRYVEFKVFGLSYSEFLSFHSLSDSEHSFMRYLRVGGLPYLRNLPNDYSVVTEYLNSIYNTILLRDVVKRFSIRNVRFLENLVMFLADHVGSLVSSKKISDYLKSQRVNISPQVVMDYLSYLESSFLIIKVKRSGLEGKRIFDVGEKYFFEDIGLRNAIVGYNSNDIHKIMENLVYLHLRMAGYSGTVGLENNKEVDFIAQRTGEKIYIQVAYMLNHERTLAREFGILL
ncbi:MAG: ATP-binding protein, partial [Flavobacteriales bacterium]